MPTDNNTTNSPSGLSLRGVFALEAARQGFKVFPIKAGAKAPPLVQEWQKVATTDEKQIRAWWTIWPDANIGIHCDGLIVLDIDTRKGGGASLVALKAQHKIPRTLEVETPSGGSHIYLKSETPVPNGVNVYGSGIDVRSQGGYVLANGSVVNGKRYQVTKDEPIAAAPDFLATRPATEKAANTERVTPLVSEPTAKERASEWLASRPVVIEGERNHKGYAAAAQCRDYGLSEADTVALMRSEWKCQPKLDEAELRHVVHSAFTYARNEEPALTATKLFDVVPETKPANDRVPLLFCGSDITTPAVRHDPYLVKGVLWQRMDSQLFGESGFGKTFLTLDMAVHIAAGREWMKRRVKQSPVMFLAYEGRDNIRTVRLPALKKQYPDIAWDTLPFAEVDMNDPLVSEQPVNQNELAGRIRLQEAIKAFAARFAAPPELIVIDTYSRAIGGDASSEVLAQKFAAMVGSLINTYGSTVLRIHHPGQKNKDRARGAYAAVAGVDTNLRVEKGKLIMDKQRDSGAGEIGFALKVVDVCKDQDGETTQTCVAIPAEIVADYSLNANQRGVMRIIEGMANANGEAIKTAVCKAAHDEGFVTSPQNLRDVLDALQRKQRIKHRGKVIKLHLDFKNVETSDDE